jgi:hypothetical protein
MGEREPQNKILSLETRLTQAWKTKEYNIFKYKVKNK